MKTPEVVADGLRAREFTGVTHFREGPYLFERFHVPGGPYSTALVRTLIENGWVAATSAPTPPFTFEIRMRTKHDMAWYDRWVAPLLFLGLVEWLRWLWAERQLTTAERSGALYRINP